MFGLSAKLHIPEKSEILDVCDIKCPQKFKDYDS